VSIFFRLPMANFFKSILSKKTPPKKEEAEGPTTTTVEEDYEDVESMAPKPTKEDFEFIAQLGKGAFGKVVLVRKKDTGKEYAMKVVFKQNVLDHGRVQDLFSERSVLRRSKHPFIVKLEYTFQSEHKLFFVMEYLQGGDLDALLNSVESKKFDEPTARFYAAEVWMALQYLHDNNIIYRDLKPENILLGSNSHACLSDFGLSKDFVDCGDGQDRANSFVGSPFYVSPDVLRQKKYGKEVDWWSFGILLFRMLAGAVPFKGSNIRAVFDSILHGSLHFSRTRPANRMPQYWRVAGLSYLQYANVCAEYVRRVLKEPERTKALSRAGYSMIKATWKDGKVASRVTLESALLDDPVRSISAAAAASEKNNS